MRRPLKTEVLCLRLADKPGELARIMGIMARNNINVVYSYSLISTYIAISVKDLKAAEDVLRGEPVELIDQSDLVGYFDSVEAQENTPEEGR